MKVEFIKAWPPYQVGETLDLADEFLESNQMFSRGIVVKADQKDAEDDAEDKEPASKQLEGAPVDKMQRGASNK